MHGITVNFLLQKSWSYSGIYMLFTSRLLLESVSEYILYRYFSLYRTLYLTFDFSFYHTDYLFSVRVAHARTTRQYIETSKNLH